MIVPTFGHVLKHGRWADDRPFAVADVPTDGAAGPLTLHVEFETTDELKSTEADFVVLKKMVDVAYA